MQSGLLELKNTFSSIAVEDPVVKEEFGRIANSIELYRNTVKSWADLEYLTVGLTNYANKLSEALDDVQTRLRDREMHLLRRVNRPAENTLTRARDELVRVGQSKKPLTVDDLIRFYWNRDAERFHKENPHLSVGEIHWLQADIQDMLIEATYVQQVKRILGQIALIQKEPHSEELQERLKLLKAFAEGEHTYEVHAHPEYLVLEYYADILFRPEQVKNLDLLQIRNGKIGDRQHLGTALEMIMGSGKSTVILPLLSILNADGDNLSIGVMPSALLPSMAAMLAERLGTSYQRMVEVVDMIRDMPVGRAFLDRLQEIRKGKKLMLMTDTSMQSLFLSFIEHLHNYSSASKEVRVAMEPERQVFRQIFTLLKEHSSLVIDEVDKILNPRTEKQYTLGNANPLHSTEVELIAALYEILETDPGIANNLRFDFSPEASVPEQAKLPLLQKTYEESVKPRLIDALIQKKFGVSDQEVAQFFASLMAPQKKLIKDYLSKQSAESVEFVSKQIPRIKDLLALAKEEIQTLLPLTCMKLTYQDYGPGGKGDFAIPYHGSDAPAEKSQHGTPYETINYTFQLLIKQGINTKMIEREVESLRNKVLLELKEKPLKGLENTAAYQEFLELVGEDRSIALFDADTVIGKVQTKVNQNLSLKLLFIKNFIAPQIKSYEYSLSANPQMYNFLFAAVNAFTGTQWNADTFPKGLRIVSDEMITGKTLGLLWKNREQSIQVVKSVSANTIVQELIAVNPQADNAHALIDAAGMIRGISREKVAAELLMVFDKRSDIKGIVFYNAQDELVILEKGKSTPISLAASELQPEERFTLYDQKHTTGADIKQASNAVAIVTVGRHTLLRDLLQSVWRLRGLDKSQQTRFVVDCEVKEIILSTLREIGIRVEGPIQLEHLLLFVSHNQAQLQGDNNFRALKHKTWEVLQQEMLKSFLDPSLEGDQLAALFESVRHLFVTKAVTSPWELFGQPSEVVDSRQAVEEHARFVKNSPAFKELSTVSSEKISQEIDRLVEKTVPLLPKKIMKSKAVYSREIEAQTETQKEQEKETEVEKTSGISDKGYQAHRKYPYMIRTLAEAINASKGLEPFADIFDAGLLSTQNLLPMYFKGMEMKGNYPPFSIFNEYQKPACALKIISKDEVVMVDQADIQERDTLYDLNLGLYQAAGGVPDFLHNPEFLRKVVQAKFFNGETHYNEEEIPLLREWIAEKGRNRIRNLFINHVLKFKETSRIAFPNSILDREIGSS